MIQSERFFQMYLMRILGLDPGTATTGFGIIESLNNEYRLLDYGCIKTKAGLPLNIRLQQIIGDLKIILNEWKPENVAIEKIYFSKNVKTAISVAHSRGALLHELSSQGFEIAEYNPQQVKMAVCGYGKADKMQIQKMIHLILQMEHFPSQDDAADALALAICHANTLKSQQLLCS